MSLPPTSHPGLCCPKGVRWDERGISELGEQGSLLPGMQIWPSSIAKELFLGDKERHWSMVDFAP